jgi:hypothetical protein
MFAVAFVNQTGNFGRLFLSVGVESRRWRDGGSRSYHRPQQEAIPTISMFDGIFVQMFYRDNRRYNLPHIHVRYQGDAASISIDAGLLLDGSLPKKQLKMVQAWIEIHKEELCVDWELAVNGDDPFRIAPLR